VVEDAGVGIQAAKAAGMAALGVSRLGDEALLRAAGADLVVTNLDDVAIEPLSGGHLTRSSADARP
jgi:beta-phosphoglucomutase